MDYNKLSSFVEVVKQGGVTKAAKVLFRTQSALSQQLSSLEKQLGVSLFDRVGRELILTVEGKEVYEAAHTRLEEIKEAIDWVLHRGEKSSGEVRVGLLQDHSTQFSFFQQLALFQKKYPLITVQVQFGTSQGIEQALLDNEIDFGFLINFTNRDLFIYIFFNGI